MNAYINEIWLGQDGNRAVHGFGLASQFYFASAGRAGRCPRSRCWSPSREDRPS